MDREELKIALANLEMYNYMRFLIRQQHRILDNLLCDCNDFEPFVHVGSCKIHRLERQGQTEVSSNSCAEERTESSPCGKICNHRRR